MGVKQRMVGMMFKMVVTIMMKAWGLVILLNHEAGALWVDLSIMFALTLLQSPQGCMTLSPCYPF